MIVGGLVHTRLVTLLLGLEALFILGLESCGLKGLDVGFGLRSLEECRGLDVGLSVYHTGLEGFSIAQSMKVRVTMHVLGSSRNVQ